MLNYLDKRQFSAYWANSSSNRLVGKLIQEGNRRIKQEFEQLLRSKTITVEIDEQIVYNQLSATNTEIRSLLLASGYLKAIRTDFEERTWRWIHHLALTNKEVIMMFHTLTPNWLSESNDDYNDFIKALLESNIKAMNTYMSKVALTTFSYFDTGKIPPWRNRNAFTMALF